MTFEEEIYFSRNYEWKSIDINRPVEVVGQFEDRIRTLYLEQAQALLDDKNKFYNSFSVGVILFCAIEWIGTFLTHKRGFENKLEEFLKHSKEFLALDSRTKAFVLKKITDCFRNGVIHNGRVKQSCQFDYDFDEKLFVIKGDLLIINTKPLYELINIVVDKYTRRVRREKKEMTDFIRQFKSEFNSELKRLV